MASSTTASFYSLPDETALKIVKMAASHEDVDYNHDFLADILCKVSIPFKRLAMDCSLWERIVIISADKNPETRHVLTNLWSLIAGPLYNRLSVDIQFNTKRLHFNGSRSVPANLKDGQGSICILESEGERASDASTSIWLLSAPCAVSSLHGMSGKRPRPAAPAASDGCPPPFSLSLPWGL